MSIPSFARYSRRLACLALASVAGTLAGCSDGDEGYRVGAGRPSRPEPQSSEKPADLPDPASEPKIPTTGPVTVPTNSGALLCGATAAPTLRGAVDVIFVVDSSESMRDEMQKIRQNINTFAANVQKQRVDMQVTLIAPRRNAAAAYNEQDRTICVPEPLAGPNCADNGAKFHQVNQVVGRNNALALFLDDYDQGLVKLRPEATKVFVVATDNASGMSARDFDDTLLRPALKGMFGTRDQRKYVFHTISGWREGTPYLSTGNSCRGTADTGVEYQRLSRLTKGQIESVCKTSYASVLDNLAAGVTERQSCDLAMPTNTKFDPTKVAVRAMLATGEFRLLEQAGSAEECSSLAGWYYDDNKAPKKVHLCASVCEEVRAATPARVEALFGCKATTAPASSSPK